MLTWSLGLPSGAVSRAGRVMHDQRAAIVGAEDGHRPAVGLDDLGDDGQTEAGSGHGPGRRRPVETVEDVGQVVGGDAGSVVADLRVSNPAPCGANHTSTVAARRAPLGGVVEHVEDGPLEQGGLAPDHARARCWRRSGATAPAAGPARWPARRSGRGAGPAARAAARPRRASSTTSPTSVVSSSSWAVTSPRRAWRSASGRSRDLHQHFDVGAQAGERGAQLVAGVGHQLGLLAAARRRGRPAWR